MKSRSPSQICALPTGGFNRCRCSSIHLRKLIGLNMGSPDGCDALQLDGDGRGKASDFHGRAAGRIVREVLGPEPVVDGEVAAQIGEEDSHVDEAIPTRPGFLEYCT